MTFGKMQNSVKAREQLLQQKRREITPQVTYDGDNRRIQMRKKSLKACKIIFNSGASVFDGVMLNRTEAGALIEVKNASFIAEEFILKMVYGEFEKSCQIAWRGSKRLGVEFD